MSRFSWRPSRPLLAIGLLAVLVSGCVASDGGGYGYYGSVGVGADYYEPYGYDYGGWGPGYWTGPYRGGHHFDGGHRAGHPHAYRAAPASHAMPSIPSRARGGGGGHGGGSRGGPGGGGHR